jgi:hypothetical protein
MQYKTIHFFINNGEYNKSDYDEINNLELGDSCNKSYSTIQHWIRRLK